MKFDVLLDVLLDRAFDRISVLLLYYIFIYVVIYTELLLCSPSQLCCSAKVSLIIPSVWSCRSQFDLNLQLMIILFICEILPSASSPNNTNTANDSVWA